MSRGTNSLLVYAGGYNNEPQPDSGTTAESEPAERAQTPSTRAPAVGAVTRGSRDARRLALVFTGHEFAEGGTTILDALARHRLKASFFLTGDFVRNPAFEGLVQRMVQDGHYVGPHSDRHLLYCAWEPGHRTLLSRESFHRDVLDNLAALERFGVSRDQARFFLPAYEHYNDDVVRWTDELGMTLVAFTPGTRSAADYTGEADPRFVPSKVIFDSILDETSRTKDGLNGFLLLLHLGAGPERADKFHGRMEDLLGALVQRGYAFDRVDAFLRDYRASSPRVFLRSNQLGYRPGEPKHGIALGTGMLPQRFAVVDVRSGRSVFEGPATRVEGARWGELTQVAELDFSDFRAPGVYRLRVGTSESSAWRIEDRVYAGQTEILLGFMRQQRCGYNPWLDAECHGLDGRTAYGPLPPGTFVDARGGWHDAADLLKYLLTSGNATAQLLLAWELGHSTGRESVADLGTDRVDASGRPGVNGIADVLDEARWGLDWMLKLHPAPDQLYHQVADDRDHYGLRLPQHEGADYGWGKGSNRVVYAATGSPQGLGRYLSESSGLANLAGRYAAAMALAYEVWKEDAVHAPFARRCLQAGEEVYQLGIQSQGVQQGNSYGAPYRYAETTWADDMEWAAAELFRATRKPQYLDEARRLAERAGAESWMGQSRAGHYQFYPFINVGHFRLHDLVDSAFRSKLEAWYREGLERCRSQSESNGFGIGVPFIWCSNNLLVALVTQCSLYERMTGDSRYRELGVRHRDWLLGRNPWGMTMFTGVGTFSPRHVHLMTTRLTGRSVAGGLVDGPVEQAIFRSLKGVSITEPDPLALFQDPRAVYHDDWFDYSTNEPTMDGTASAILMWAAALR